MSSERAARSDLLQKVQAQEEKIKRYETRLRDLVVAYRTLTKEKTTLEETVKALSVPQTSSSSADAESSSESADLQGRVEALSQSLAALTEEKRQMEASYVADRKKLMKEQEEALSSLRRELDSAEIVRRELQRERAELQGRLREQRLAAERAEDDQACMMRELQSLLTSERGAREQLEFEVEALQESLAAAEAAAVNASVAASGMETQEHRLRDLRNEVEQLRGRQTATEAPLEELQAELVALKAEHRVALQRENERANEAELRLKEFTRQHEERVATLEARLTDLSLELGNQERTRAADQTAIAKLRDRIAQLDMENSTLAATTSLKEQEDEKTLEVQADVKDVLQEEEAHQSCKEELQALREEFERYKLKAQSVLLKQQTAGRAVPLLSKEEAERIQQQVVRLKERSRELQEELVNEERANKRALTNLKRAKEEAAAAHAREVAVVRQNAERRVTEVADELTRLRNRTLALLAEKDDEIALLRAGEASKAQALRSAASMNALLRSDAELTAAASAPAAACSLIHCRQERARLATENRQLRETYRECDAQLREVKGALIEAEERQAEAERFAARLREVSGAAKAGSLDLEYLKNVVLRFATTADPDSKRTMLRAIAAVLHFSPAEANSSESERRLRQDMNSCLCWVRNFLSSDNWPQRLYQTLEDAEQNIDMSRLESALMTATSLDHERISIPNQQQMVEIIRRSYVRWPDTLRCEFRQEVSNTVNT